MTRLRSRQDLRHPFGYMAETWVFPAVIILVIAAAVTGFSALINSDLIGEANNRNTAREHVMSYVNVGDQSERTARINTLIDMDSRGMSTDLNVVADFDPSTTYDDDSGAVKRKAEVVQSLRDAINSPRLLTLAPEMHDWSGWQAFLFWLVIATIAAEMTWLLIVYGMHCDNDDHFMVDLPWRKIWPVGFVLLTLLPVGFIVYAVSFVRFRMAVAAGAERRDTRYDRFDPYRYVDVPPRNVEPEVRQAPALPVFTDAPVVSRAHYKDLRMNRWKRIRDERLRDAKSNQAFFAERLKELGESIKEYQAKRGTITAEIRRLESATGDGDPLDEKQIDAEFDLLMSFPGVTKVRVVNDTISLLVQARVTYEGRLYDIGDYELRFGGPDPLVTRQLRSGARPDWGGHYPVYGGSNSFCYGNRAGLINEHINKGEFVIAIELAVNSLRSINPGHEYLIPSAFYAIEETDTTEAKEDTDAEPAPADV